MALNPDLIKESLGKAYVQAVASQAGFICNSPSPDVKKVDLQIDAVNELGDVILEIQLKSTIMNAVKISGTELHYYDVDPKTYNKLCQDRHNPLILVVFVMPNDPKQWIEHTQNELTERHCAYWISLKGKQTTTNKTSQVVSIPLTNVLSPCNLRAMMDRIYHTGVV